MYVVINGRVAIECDKSETGAFYHCGSYYKWERISKRRNE
jgi:hypothetical protein